MGIEVIGTEPGTLGELVMWIPGKPQTAGSKTAIVKPGQKPRVIESGSDESRARKRTWRGDLKDAGDHARGEQWGLNEPTFVALDVLFVFVRSRPSEHLRAGRLSGAVKDWAIGLRPVKRPDALKMARAAEDALTGVLWLDDSQIVSERLEKVFGDDVGLDPRAEGLLMVVRQAGRYRGPIVMVRGGAAPLWDLTT
jgi:Holliday junction resolvase RusA-like endonuclease